MKIEADYEILEDNIDEILEYFYGYVIDYVMNEIKKLPNYREVKCCNKTHKLPITKIHFKCPICRKRRKLRGFGAIGTEIEDVVDTVKEYLKQSKREINNA